MDISQFSEVAGDILNSESTDRQFGKSDVYDNSAMGINRNRFQARGREIKIMLEKEKGQSGRATGKLIGPKE